MEGLTGEFEVAEDFGVFLAGPDADAVVRAANADFFAVDVEGGFDFVDEDVFGAFGSRSGTDEHAGANFSVGDRADENEELALGNFEGAFYVKCWHAVKTNEIGSSRADGSCAVIAFGERKFLWMRPGHSYVWGATSGLPVHVGGVKHGMFRS